MSKGFFHLWVIFVVLTILISVLVFNNLKPIIKPTSTPTTSPSPKPTVVQSTASPATTPASQQVQKGNLETLEKYCMQEVLKLPEAPFTYKSKEGPTRSGPMGWVDQFIPKDKKESEKKSCTMSYRFDGKVAYPQLGAKYPMGLNEFDREIRLRLLGKIDSSWKIVSGNSISNDGLTLVLKRENPQMRTVDYLDAFDGGGILYIKFNTYYK